MPEGLELLQEHGFDFIFGPFSFPGVVGHNEILAGKVFNVNENKS
jgi:hypothetical protein